ncbi:hydroxyacylglutathione hydrolase [Capsaspora owczarzaki ATCC 30864]|uniref:Hydroxyacylglutathione hydrolase n=1 Tax=Capsaspora owczarzaki (strain ATCC 30864) TaxID=595528 RepID=A0A0D2WU00_CAPO3|nr:hydroxyacylglutathione hydrolase [Capsaspora owczarzaki ATCC 30864]
MDRPSSSRRYAFYTSSAGYYYHRYQLRKAAKTGGPIIDPFEYPIPGGLHTVLVVPNRKDNYTYVVLNNQTRDAVVVDPADPASILPAIEKANVKVLAVLTTHKHHDHSAGNWDMAQHFPGVAIVGSPTDNIPSLTHPVSHGDVLTISTLVIHCISTPGHTPGHIVYHLQPAAPEHPGSIFSGDCLFVGGSGQMFEGTPADMYLAMERLRELSGSTLVWPGHEYASPNLDFVAVLEPSNAQAVEGAVKAKERLARREGSIPSTITDELAWNPYFRVHAGTFDALVLVPGQPEAIRQHRVAVLAEIRRQKNVFSPGLTGGN